MKKIILAVVISFLIGIAIGYGASTYLKEKEKKKEAKVEEKEKKEKETKEKEEKPKEATTAKIKVYFSDENAEYLVPEIREAKSSEVAKAAILELIKGPEASGHLPTIPQGTKLLGLSIKGGIAYVDFSKEFVENHPGGSSGELMTVYSVVNTLTEFPTIKRVRFLVEGRKIETLKEHVDLSMPVSRDETLIKKQ